MHIDTATHEHRASAKVYSYEADFQVGADAIDWQASVSVGNTQLEPIRGSIPLTSPALPVVAEQAVRDEIVRRIDGFEGTTSGVTRP